MSCLREPFGWKEAIFSIVPPLDAVNATILDQHDILAGKQTWRKDCLENRAFGAMVLDSRPQKVRQ